MTADPPCGACRAQFSRGEAGEKTIGSRNFTAKIMCYACKRMVHTSGWPDVKSANWRARQLFGLPPDDIRDLRQFYPDGAEWAIEEIAKK